MLCELAGHCQIVLGFRILILIRRSLLAVAHCSELSRKSEIDERNVIFFSDQNIAWLEILRTQPTTRRVRDHE